MNKLKNIKNIGGFNMKITKIKSFLALSLSAVAMLIATTSSTMCSYFCEEPKMPKSLYKVD